MKPLLALKALVDDLTLHRRGLCPITFAQLHLFVNLNNIYHQKLVQKCFHINLIRIKTMHVYELKDICILTISQLFAYVLCLKQISYKYIRFLF